MKASLGKISRIPRHVKPSLVFDFDMFKDPGYRSDPFKRVKELKELAPPVFWTPYNGGHWIVQGYDAATTVGSTPTTFSSEVIPHSKLRLIEKAQKFTSKIGIKTPRIPLPYPILVDPPLHTQYRRPVASVFSPKNVKPLEERFRQSARLFINQIADQGGCEFVSTVGEPLPVTLFLQLFGLPIDNLPEYRALLKKGMSDSTEVTNNIAKLVTLIDIVNELRDTLIDKKENRKDDLISKLWDTEINGKPVDLDDMENYGLTLFLGGLDTVVQAMGFSMRHLAMDQELQQFLRDNPNRIPDAIEEILRRYAIATPARRVLHRTELEGATLKKNDVTYLFLHGANLDAGHFENPEKVDIDRTNKSAHITFNSGPHFCLGAHLARMELRVLFEEMFAQLPMFKLDPLKPPKFHVGFIVGVDSLNLVW